MRRGQRYRLTKDTLYCGYINRHEVTTTLKEGEVCEYFAHSDTYLFEGRESLEGARITPYYPASVVEGWGFWFEIVPVGCGHDPKFLDKRGYCQFNANPDKLPCGRKAELSETGKEAGGVS